MVDWSYRSFHAVARAHPLRSGPIFDVFGIYLTNLPLLIARCCGQSGTLVGSFGIRDACNQVRLADACRVQVTSLTYSEWKAVFWFSFPVS